MEEPRYSSHPAAGFTLVELMVVLAVFTILASAGIPALQAMLADHRHAAQVNTLTSYIHRARAEAVRHGHPVTLCPSSGAATCDGGEWEEGWLLFADTDGDGSVDDDDRLLAVGNGLRTAQASFNRPRLTFRHDGTTAFNGTFTVCDARSERARQLVISRGGRLRRGGTNPANCP
jgi:type IV fimbrial biogenesis protein FimT